MQNRKLLLRSLRYFIGYNPARFALIFFLTMLLGLNQGVSVLMLIPLLHLLDGGNAAGSDRMVAWLDGLLSKLGITLNLEVILLSFISLLLLISLLSYWRLILQSRYEQGFVYWVRSHLFAKVTACDWLTLNAKSKHAHIQVLSTEIPKMVGYYFALVSILTGLVIIAAHVAVALMVSVRFTLVVLLLATLSFASLKRFFLRSFRLGGVNVGVFRLMLKQLDDFWLMVKPAKVHNAERFYFEQYDRSCREMLNLQMRQSVNRQRSQLVFTIVGVMGLMLVLYFGYHIERLSMTSIFVMVLLFGRLFPLFLNINSNIDTVANNIQSVRLVMDTDEQLPEAHFRTAASNNAPSLQGDIQLVDISFAYDDAPILNHFSATIPLNRITGILGESGGGKTTLVDLIAGLIRPSSGEVRVGGHPLSDGNVASWKESLAYLPQDSFFIDGTIRDNLVWDSAKVVSDDQIWEVLRSVQAHTIVDREPKGLYTSISNYQYHFSGGERQRLALARVLLRFPKVLLLDEATSALDVRTEHYIMEQLRSLRANMTIVLVTHRQALVHHFDHVIYLDRSPLRSQPLSKQA